MKLGAGGNNLILTGASGGPLNPKSGTKSICRKPSPYGDCDLFSAKIHVVLRF